jgi:hypothetical protein
MVMRVIGGSGKTVPGGYVHTRGDFGGGHAIDEGGCSVGQKKSLEQTMGI